MLDEGGAYKSLYFSNEGCLLTVNDHDSQNNRIPPTNIHIRISGTYEYVIFMAKGVLQM